DHDENIFIGREMTQAKGYSEATAQKIDAEVALLVDRAYKKGKEILEANIDILHRLTDLLIEKETVLGAELDDLIAQMRPDYDFHGRRNVRTFHEPTAGKTAAPRKEATDDAPDDQTAEPVENGAGGTAAEDGAEDGPENGSGRE
ncbi:MAG: cell division protein FtsH, partial [Desulfotignum sp.]